MRHLAHTDAAQAEVAHVALGASAALAAVDLAG